MITRTKQIDLAYMAGFLDGEGCVGIFKRSGLKYGWQCSFNVYVSFTNTNKEILEYIQSIFGGFMQKKKLYKKYHTPAYTLHIRDLKAQPCLEKLYPYVRIKKKNIELVLDFLKNIKKQKPDYGRKTQKTSKEEMEKREKYYIQSKLLNHRAKSYCAGATTKYENTLLKGDAIV